MATKINQTFYGNEANFITVSSNVKKSPYTLPTIVTGSAYTGGALDYSASPWGIGESSVSNHFSVSIAKGAEWTYNEYNREAKNTPLFLYSVSDTQEGAYNNAGLVGSGVTSYNYELALFRSRIDPDVTLDQHNRFLSSLSVDSGDSVNFAGTENTYPITYLDYQTVKAVVGHVYYKPVGENTIKKTTLDAIISNSVSVDSIVYFDFVLYDGNSVTAVDASIGGNELELLDVYKSVYYEDIDTIVSPARKIGRFGYWYIDENWYDQDGFHYGPSDSYTYYQSEWDTLGNNWFIPPNPVYTGWSTLSGKNQEFDDVSYHWEYGITAYDSNQWNITKIENGDTYASNVYRSFAYLELDDYTGSKNEAYVSAILHELAFLGFPIVASTSHLSSTIGDNDVYVPVFDEHMITTGEYANGAASLALPNATWRDVFGSEMPDYDPTYDPEPGPGPGPDDDEDSGNLINRGLYTNKFNNPAYTVWALYGTSLSNNGLDAIIEAINKLYITDPDGNSKWELNFKGSNPSDYIVGLFAYPLHFATSDNSYVFTLGPVDFETINVYKYADNGYFTFGNIDLGYNSRDVKWFKDFRDFPPYTTAELYVPFCGTTDIDLTFFIGHTMTIDMYYDIYTGSCSAAVYRDNITLYKVMNGQIGVQLPLTSVRAGDYQNNIHALENALKQNDIRLATSALALGASAATAIATGGTSLIAGAGAIGGISSFINTLNAREEIEYKLDHTQPTVAQTGAAETQNGYRVGGNRAKLFIKRTKMLKDYKQSTYSRTIGHACCINDTIGNRTGLVVCGAVDTSGIPATVEEINAIKQALSSGVYV